MNPNRFAAFLSSLAPSVYPVLGNSFSRSLYCPLDLSIHNPDLSTIDVSSASALEEYVQSVMAVHRAKVAYGGYLEPRGIYRRSSHFNQSDPRTERNIHLGLDLWIDAFTPVFAPLDGVLHSFKNNTGYGDYGPTLILEHRITDQLFYTLYGHLSAESLDGKKKGQTIGKGEQIATLGTPEVNGNYAPHLHFQLIRDLQGLEGDYPGVSNRRDLDFYKHNCPDPNLLLVF
jgi:murein DD-endopeptidase MepM/ murein hydrolase activator NlpD